MIPAIPADWRALICKYWEEEKLEELLLRVEELYETQQVFPTREDLFTALELTPVDAVKVVILGQDPYHDDGQAHGLSFSVQEGVALPPSLRNIYRELQDDQGVELPTHGNLSSWAKQGVLLLNTVLTVRAHQAHSHKGIGWEEMTDAIIRGLNDSSRPMVFVLWGKPAQEKKRLLTNEEHLVLCAPHPSPLSSYRGFFGSRPFGKVNAFLEEKGEKGIVWG
jgi:uracil-DNA glycosylase